ncbi:hypothetical protein N9L68_00415 [bacterium]|nr:hypothetical protein [bacterium]
MCGVHLQEVGRASCAHPNSAFSASAVMTYGTHCSNHLQKKKKKKKKNNKHNNNNSNKNSILSHCRSIGNKQHGLS